MKSSYGKHPSAMKDKYDKIPLENSDIFLIRRLDVPDYKTGHPSAVIHNTIHSFIYITQGEILISIGKESYLLKSNECAVIPAGQYFSIRYYNDCKGFMGGFHTDFLQGNNILSSYSFLHKFGNHKVWLDHEHANYVSFLFERLYAENEKDKNKNILASYLTSLLAEIDDAYKKTNSESTKISIENKLCNDFIEAVFKKPDQRFSILHYATQLNVAQSHLHKIVKQYTGKTPLTWINEAIILEAKTMLIHTDMPISEVASKLGIFDPSYFARLFKKHTGITPIAFRKRIKYPQKS